MIILQWCKMQIMCLMILIYISCVFIAEGNSLNKLTRKSYCNKIFDINFIIAEIAVLFDGITACTVNFLDEVPRIINVLLHLGMFVSYELYIASLFWYWVSVTVGIPKKKWAKAAYILPSVFLIILTVCYIPDTEFVQGKYTNYSMGTSVYICFISVAVYLILTIAVIIAKQQYIPKKKLLSLATTLIFIVIILTLQIVFPEYLVSGMAAALITISIYLNMENPTIHSLEHYHNEMVMGFATLVENKDDSTGGHIRRSSAYANLIARNLRKNKKYKNIVTKDYINNLSKSAPMHDIGKIGIPDAILQKSEKLTSEEFEKMKEHAVIGGKIIRSVHALWLWLMCLMPYPQNVVTGMPCRLNNATTLL